MTLPKTVQIVEVSPRDGLQNEIKNVPTDVKVAFIEKLVAAGFSTIEATSFVSSQYIPQLQDAETVYSAINHHSHINFPVLIPNLKGLERAKAVHADHFSIFIASSETFSKKNTNCSIAESLQRMTTIFEHVDLTKYKIRGYISCVLGCPYEGKTDFKVTARLAKKLLELGCYEVALGDTIGVGTVNETQTLLKTLFDTGVKPDQLAVHFHDTYGQALVNIYAALQFGIRTVDASVSGLGGCPYAKGATGNVATEDVLYFLKGLGIETGIQLDKAIQAGDYISNYLQRTNQSKVAIARGNKNDKT